MPKPKASVSKVKSKKVLKRLRRDASYANNNYGNYDYGNGNFNNYGGNFADGRPFDPNLPPGGVLYFQPFNVGTTSSSSITIINNTIAAGGGEGGQQNLGWSSSEFEVWQQYNQQLYQDTNNDSYMPFEWQLPYSNNDNEATGNFWEDETPEAISNPKQVNKQSKKSPKGLKQNDNRLKSQDSAIHSSVFANQTEFPPIVPRRQDKSTNSSAMDNPVNPFETVEVEIPSEDTIFHNMLKKPTFNIKNKLAAYNQLVELPLSVQIDKLVESSKLSREQLRIRWQLAFDLLYLLRYHYPTCEVYGIDSILTHFKKMDSSLSCDVQLYVDLTGSELTFEDSKSLQNIIQQVKSILGAHRCPHPRVDGCLPFIKMFMKNEKTDKVIQFMHEPSQLTCQLTFQSQFPAKRSQLIRYCSKLDPKICQFIGVLRYWGQYYGISDDWSTGASKISEYALFLLGLVYLMEEKMMPPVANLPTDLLKPLVHKKGGLGKGSGMGGEENVGEAVMQLMKGFCEKYANLDFKAVTVLPLTGKIIPRQAFPGSSQGLLAKSVEMGAAAAVCIDPFGFKKNVFEGKDVKVALQYFQVACKKTVTILEENGCYQQKNSVLDLFIASPQQQPKNNMEMLTLKMNNDFPVVYMTKLASANKILDSFSSIQKIGTMRRNMYNLWKKFAEEFILDIFPTGFKLPPPVEKSLPDAKGFKKLYRVTYPFWERMVHSELVNEEDYQSQDPIQVEKIKSTAILVNYLARKGKQNQLPFQEFWIQVDYTFNVSGEGVLEMQVRLLKVPQDKCLPLQDSHGTEYTQMVPAVFRVIQRVFQQYLIYKLNAFVIDV